MTEQAKPVNNSPVFLRTLIALLAAFAVTTSASADPLMVGSRIAKILNVRSANDASFVVQTEGGTGTCAGSWIYFYPAGSSAAAAEAHKRAYAAVLMAMTTGMRVDIESVDASCSGAYAIFVYP